MDWDEEEEVEEEVEEGGTIPSGGKQGATHEKVIKQDAHQWMPQAEKARRATNEPRGRRGMFVHKDICEPIAETTHKSFNLGRLRVHRVCF